MQDQPNGVAFFIVSALVDMAFQEEIFFYGNAEEFSNMLEVALNDMDVYSTVYRNFMRRLREG